MNCLSCKYHFNKQALFIVWNKDQLMFICEECISSNIIDTNTQSNKWKKLVIEKAIREPDHFFSQFELNEKNKIRIQALQKYSFEQFKYLIENTEKHIQEIQCILDRIINDLKLEVVNINENKYNHRKQLEQVQIYQNFRSTLDLVYNSQTQINLEIINQCENNLKQLCHNIESNPIQLNTQLERIFINCNIIKTQEFQHNKQLKDQLYQIQLLIQPFKNKYNCLSSIVSEEFLEELLARIQLNSKKKIIKTNLIFDGKNDRLNATMFWKKVQNKENLLMIFKSNKNYIFGAYSPCKWVYTKNHSYADKTKSSFIFSKTNNTFHPILDKDYKAINCNKTKGPCFGYCENGDIIEYDLSIDEDFQGGCSYLGNNYLWNNDEAQKLNTHLFGQIQPKIINCEIYEITFS
ncbi:unnamed protein product [Paramecium pentaurelia]|uniref:TLDc domain-containing protein n=1 Tax=Paramecium pentaurelia TaxID=43138 RepID=A0A8S1WFC4_9CILI|nr:unnamed protein product [Paramecium pentaurelia]